MAVFSLQHFDGLGNGSFAVGFVNLSLQLTVNCGIRHDVEEYAPDGCCCRIGPSHAVGNEKVNRIQLRA
jgi:hypothetical protein